MPRARVYRAEQRAEVLRLLAEGNLPVAEIGARTGVKVRTIHVWNVRAGWLRPPRRRWMMTATWPAERRAAVVRLLCTPGNDSSDVTEALGFGRLTPDRMVTAFGRALQLPPEVLLRPSRGAATDPAILRDHLRAHIVRQIAAFDAALSGAGPDLRDSARVLRDLGGLKRLLDTVDADGARRAGGEGGDGDTEPDLVAQRAEIARRYAGFVGSRAAA